MCPWVSQNEDGETSAGYHPLVSGGWGGTAEEKNIQLGGEEIAQG